jgi:Fic family protein
MKLPVSSLAKCLVSEYAHQSVQIEDNRLQLGDSIKIYDFLASSFFQPDLSTMSSQDLYQADIPEVNFLLPDADASQVTELRNHILASQWIAETASQQPGTPGLDEDNIRHLSAVTIKGTASEALYTRGWGDRVKLGGYRSTPISVRSNPLCIFPYHVEVPALMKRFFEWRGRVHNTKSLHPLIAACQITTYFLHIHPFPDGNGRVSRMLMQDYLVRQGYLPIVMQSLDRKDYLRMIIEAQQGEPDEFVNRVVTTQLEEMQTFKAREL